MRITAGLFALLLVFGVPPLAVANEEVASFSARWPDAPMRKPTLQELVRLVAGAIKQEARTELEARVAARRQATQPCRDEICRLLNSQ